MQRDTDAPRREGTKAREHEPIGAHPGRAVVGDPVVEQRLELRMQGDEAVVVELANRDPQPLCRPDLDHGIDGERSQFAQAHPGPGQELDDDPGERVGIGPRRSELGGRSVVEKSRQGLVEDREVPGELERALRRGGVAPLGWRRSTCTRCRCSH